MNIITPPSFPPTVYEYTHSLGLESQHNASAQCSGHLQEAGRDRRGRLEWPFADGY